MSDSVSSVLCGTRFFVRMCCERAPAFFIEDVWPPNYVIYCPVCRHRVSGKNEAVVVEVWNHVEEF